MHAKLAEGEHGAPVVERRLLQPRLPPQDGRDVVVAGEHLARNLCVAWFVGPDQPQTIPAEDRYQPIEEEECGEDEESRRFQRHGERRKARGEGREP